MTTYTIRAGDTILKNQTADDVVEVAYGNGFASEPVFRKLERTGKAKINDDVSDIIITVEK